MDKKTRLMANKGLFKHLKKPDVDNLVKLYLDVLSGIVFEDDNCVSLGFAIKIYSPDPKTIMYIEETTEHVTLDEVWEGTWPTQ